MNKNLKLRVVMVSARTSLQTQSFLWQLACAWRAHGLYVSPSLRDPQIIVWLCVTSVWKSINAANPASGVPRATRSKFAQQASTRKLRFPCGWRALLGPGLVGCKSRKHKSGGGLRTQVSWAASAISHTLANLTTWRPPRGRERIVIWLILPVVICLSQRLSHACLSISTCTVKLRMAH